MLMQSELKNLFIAEVSGELLAADDNVPGELVMPLSPLSVGVLTGGLAKFCGGGAPIDLIESVFLSSV